MAEKKEGNAKSQILNAISSRIVPIMKEGFSGIMRRMQDAVHHMQKKIIEHLVMAAMMIVGFIFICIGVVFFINDYFMLEKYWGFLIVGVALMLIAFLFKKHIEKTRYCGEGKEVHQ